MPNLFKIQEREVSAKAACLNCRRQKKKCDKKEPSCSRCIFYLARCEYEIGNQNISASNASTAAPFYQGLKQSSSFDLISNSTQVQAQDIDQALMSHVCSIIALTEVSINDILRDHFRSTGHWFPMISRRKMYTYLVEHSSAPRADMALLLLSMYLSIQLPSQLENGKEQPLYSEIKQLLCFVESATDLSIEIVQANLLLAVFEYGQGRSQPSFITIGACYRMTQALGWHMDNTTEANHTTNGEPPIVIERREERRRVWWAIVALDSLINVGFIKENLTFAAEMFNTPFEMPGSNENWDFCDQCEESRSPFPKTAAIQAESAQLARSIFSHVVNPPADPKIKELKAFNLTQDLIASAINIVNNAQDNWGSHCEAFNLNNCTLFLLHRDAYRRSSATYGDASDFERFSLDTLESRIKLVKSTLKELYKLLPNIETLALPLFTLQTISDICLIHIYHTDEGCGKSEWMEDLNTFQGLLGLFAKRWKLSGHYMRKIDEAYNQHMAAKLNFVSLSPLSSSEIL